MGKARPQAPTLTDDVGTIPRLSARAGRTPLSPPLSGPRNGSGVTADMWHPLRLHRIVTPDLFRGPRRGKFPGMRDRQPCVYILASGFNGTLYTGVTSNLIGRIMQHRDGTYAGFTSRYGIVRLVWFDTTETMADAIASEKRIKAWRRDWKKNLIERDNPDWHDLGVALGLPPLD